MGLPSALGLAAKTPVVKWGQRPDRIYLTIPLPEVSDPEIKMEDKRIHFKGSSRGEAFEANLKLLRPINVTESKHDINSWSITFDLKKSRKEPCWKRLLKAKDQHSWLKKDQNRWYTDECQHAKELRREAYFTAKNNGQDPNTGTAAESGAGSDSAAPPPDEEKRKEAERFQEKLNEFRSRAVPRKSSTKKKSW